MQMCVFLELIFTNEWDCLRGKNEERNDNDKRSSRIRTMSKWDENRRMIRVC